jgi:6-phosphofructokinase 1
MNKTHENGKVGILVGGGPAPGINGVIHSVTIEAINNGKEVLGIFEGFKYLIQGKAKSKSRDLTINDVSRIHLAGGSILLTSRANPTKREEDLRATVESLMGLGIKYLVTVGGDDTAYSACQVARYAREEMGVELNVAHVPKTIDNDLPLPGGIPTFGFETARDVGTFILRNLMEDALTGQRWYLVVTMGRKAGHLALGIGKSSGATITLIPEEWGDREIRIQEVVDILATSLIKRRATGKPYGVAVVAEGIIEQMSPEDFEALEDAEQDAHGHIRLSELNASDILKSELRYTLDELGLTGLRVINKDVGYELRCADPIAYDIDYTRSLGEAAMEFLLKGKTDAIITIQQNFIVPIPFDEMMDPETGRTEVRTVNTESFPYRSAQKFMIRLGPADAKNEELLQRMADETNLSLGEFKERFGYLMGIAERPF